MKRLKAIIVLLCKVSPWIALLIATIVNHGLKGDIKFSTMYWTLVAVGWILYIGYMLDEAWNKAIDYDEEDYATDESLSADFYQKKNFAYKEYDFYAYRVNTSYDENEIADCKKIRELYLREYQTYVALETEALEYYLRTYPDKFNAIEQVKL